MDLFRKASVSNAFQSILLILVLNIFCFTNSYSLTPKEISNVQCNSYSITITTIDTILVVDTNSFDNLVNKVQVLDAKGQQVLTFNGCHQSTCSFDLGELPTGLYNVIVQTNLGKNHSGTIKLEN